MSTAMGQEAIDAKCNMGHSNSVQIIFFRKDGQVLKQVAQRGTLYPSLKKLIAPLAGVLSILLCLDLL